MRMLKWTWCDVTRSDRIMSKYTCMYVKEEVKEQ